ncbi:phage lytic cycle repressor MrpR family protein [Paenibacillus sp. USHLN196]|uniref:phage lytic cycle repressor MrpR family protein n=1 Tax=Paenibacillus sp. USHLN196 TaxID=3081291 RepID=UPI00301A8366
MNKIYDEEFFNKEQKDRYLQNLSDATKKAYGRVLKRVSIMEKKLDKDLYDFNLQEISQFLYLLKSTKVSSLQQAGSIINNYIGWAIEQDLRKDNINPLNAVTSFEWYSQFVDDSRQTLFTEEDIENVVEGCLNFQDKAVVQALFEGIMGRENSELLNMKMEHIIETNEIDKYKIKLFNESRDGQEIREIIISGYLYNILRIANKEDKYIKNNGNLVPSTKVTHNNLIDNDYIIRSAVNSSIKQGVDEPASIYLVTMRLSKIAEWHNLPLLTIVNVRNSGMLKMAKDLYVERGKLEEEEYSIVCDHYNIKKDKNGLYHYGSMKSEFLNVPTIKKVYNL